MIYLYFQQLCKKNGIDVCIYAYNRSRHYYVAYHCVFLGHGVYIIFVVRS